MYGNIKYGPTSIKGEIGEIIAKHHLPDTFRLNENSKNFIKKHNLNGKQITFLQENGGTFDLVDINSLIIYEVKTKKFLYRNLVGVKNKPPITPHLIALFEEAFSIGFKIKVVEITLFSDWKYGLIIKDFNKDAFWIYKKKASGWSAWVKKKDKLSKNN